MKARLWALLCATLWFSLQNAGGATKIKNILVNGDAEGSFGSVPCAVSRVYGGQIQAAETEWVDGSHVFVVHSTKRVEHNWDNQFWIQAPEPLTVGQKLKLSFRYKAAQPASIGTECHAEPGNYLDWNCIGSIDFATVWRTYSAEITVRNEGMQSIAFDLSDYEPANDYYFDDLVLGAEIEESNAYDNLLENGDAEGSYADPACAWAKEDRSSPFPANIETRAGNKIFVVQASDKVSDTWDNQFWIMAPRTFQEGETFTVSFAYKALNDAPTSTQSHSNPGSYLHWEAIGNVNFTTDWQVFHKTVSVKREMDGMQSIAFNLSEQEEANTYYFDNIFWWEGEHERVNLPLPAEFTDNTNPGGGEARLVINEIMQSNVDCIMDDKNEFPDSWVELYNAGNVAVNLQNYRVGETDDINQATRLPTRVLQPGEYYLVYCDKLGSGRHLNFRLESGKDCAFFLFDKQREICDRLPEGMKKQPAPNIAFGRKTDGGDEWGYQLRPTPGEANSGETVDRKMVLEEPLFSQPGCILRKGKQISVSLSVPQGSPEGTVIRYTLDGGEPTETSAVYEKPVVMNKNTVLRAKLFCKGWLSPRSTTHSYIWLDRDVTLPVISLATDDRFLTDPEIGIYVRGNADGGTPNYEKKWRRPMNFEFFESDNLQASAMNQLCEARVAGAWSRGFPLKTLAVYANKRFGTKHFQYEFFPEQRPGRNDFKSILLRNAGNDFDYIYMRDAVVHRVLSSHVSADYQAWQPAIVFINGEYKGILNIRERSNEDNIYTNYDGLEDIDMIENWWEVKTGTQSRWNDFTNFYGQSGHSYEEFAERLDVQEFMDVMIINLLHCNLDFPGNNFMLWRPREDGGRWRALMKDSDYSFGIYEAHKVDYPIFEWLYTPGFDPDHNWGNSSGATRLFRRLMETERFRSDFLDRFAIYMGDFLSHRRTMEILEPMAEKIAHEYPFHRELYGQSWKNYEYELNRAKDWLRDRIPCMYTQLSEYYNLGKAIPLTITIEKPETRANSAQLSSNDEDSAFFSDESSAPTIVFNGFPLTQRSFDGRFYTNREMVLESDEIVGWTVKETYGNRTTTRKVEGSALEYTIPQNANAVSIVATQKHEDIIDALPSNFATSTSTIYNLSGFRQPALSRGINIVRQADGSVKKKVVK